MSESKEKDTFDGRFYTFLCCNSNTNFAGNATMEQKLVKHSDKQSCATVLQRTAEVDTRPQKMGQASRLSIRGDICARINGRVDTVNKDDSIVRGVLRFLNGDISARKRQCRDHHNDRLQGPHASS